MLNLVFSNIQIHYADTLYFLKAAKVGKASYGGTSFRLGFLPCPPSPVDNRIDFEMKKKENICIDFACLESHTLYSVSLVSKTQSCVHCIGMVVIGGSTEARSYRKGGWVLWGPASCSTQ